MNLSTHFHVYFSANHERRGKKPNNCETWSKESEVVHDACHLSENDSADEKVSQVHGNESNNKPSVTEKIRKIILDDS
jgi:hypothetical protein